MRFETLDDLLRYQIELNASDLHMSHNARISYRIDGELEQRGPKITGREIFDLVLPAIIKKSELQSKLRQEGSADFRYSLDQGKYNFRGSLNLTASGQESATFRLIPPKVIPIDQLNLPPIIKKMANREWGLLLVTGPTGSGKSTTLASIVDYINENKKKKIITFEDPIEYEHKNKQSLVEQNEVGIDTPSFAAGMKGVLRRDPDVILVGELRDLDTISSTQTAADTGHFVMGTLHTNNAPQTISRILGVYPGIEREQARLELADHLIGVVSQRIYKKPGGGRTVVFEVMVVDEEISELIRVNQIHKIYSVMRKNKEKGNIIMADSYQEKKEQGLIQDTTE